MHSDDVFGSIELRVDLERAIVTLHKDGTLTGWEVIIFYLWMRECSFREIGDILSEPHTTVKYHFDLACATIRDSGLLADYEL